MTVLHDALKYHSCNTAEEDEEVDDVILVTGGMGIIAIINCCGDEPRIINKVVRSATVVQLALVITR
jgi:hypothetical protein